MPVLRTIRSWRLGAMFAVTVALIFCTVAPAAADEQPGYLALGDSLAFGFIPGFISIDRTTAANQIGYPEVLSAATNLQLANASCPGETSSHMLNTSIPDNGCGWTGPTPKGNLPQGYHTVYPLHVNYSPTTAQEDYAIAYLQSHPNIQLITISLGANDVFLLQKECNGNTSCVLAGLPTVLQSLRANLSAIYTRIRGTGYHGPIVALTYYSPNYTDSLTTAVTTQLNTVIISVTQTSAVRGTVADGFTAFLLASQYLGHPNNPCAAGLLIPDPSVPGTCNIHPTHLGHTVLAGAIALAVGQRLPSLQTVGR